MRPDAVESGQWPRPSSCVLIVESEAASRRRLARALSDSGMDVHEAGTVAGALDAIGSLSNALEVAILDYVLPRGEATSEWSREALAGTATARTVVEFVDRHEIGAAIILIADGTDDVMRQIARQTRSDACLRKPVEPEWLLAVVERALAWHAQRGYWERHEVAPVAPHPVTTRPGGYAEGRLRVALRLAGIPESDETMIRVCRLALAGERLETACKTCGMSESTYKRATRALRMRLGVRDFAHDLTQRIDAALADGSVQWWELLGEPKTAAAFDRPTGDRRRGAIPEALVAPSD